MSVPDLGHEGEACRRSAHRATASGGAIALILLLYLLFLWPSLYIGVANQVGPRFPQTWPPVALGLLLCFLALTRRVVGGRRYVAPGTLLAVLLFAWVTIIILVTGDVREFAHEYYYVFLLGHAIFGGAMLVAGLHLAEISLSLRTLWGRSCLAAVAVIFAGTILSSSLGNPIGDLIPWYLVGITRQASDTGGAFNYIFVSDSLAIAGLLVLSQPGKFRTKAAVALATIVLLFWTTSRSSLAMFTCVAAAMLFVHWRRLPTRSKLLAMVPLAAVMVVVLSVMWPIVADMATSSAALRRFDVTSIAEDRSLGERRLLGEIGLARLKQDWVVGHFMGEVLEGREGQYIHNGLSFLQSYGAGPFALLVALLLASVLGISKAYLRDPTRRDLEFPFTLAWFGCLSLTFTRAYGSNWIWLILTGIPSVLTAYTVECCEITEAPSAVDDPRNCP